MAEGRDELSPTDLPWPYLTRGLPGVGGAIKTFDEDFIVEELPLYEPCDEGTHLYIHLEKRGITTLEAVARIARALGKPERSFGFAGMKDARGVTRQTISIEHVPAERVTGLSIPRVTILGSRLHTNKLHRGHVAGNRFTIRVRGCRRNAAEAARAILDVLQQRGAPNYYGPQRFGAHGNNAAIGQAVLKGDFAGAFVELLGRPSAAERRDVQQARRLFEAGEHEKAGATWPPAFQQERRLCRIVARHANRPDKAWRYVREPLRKLLVSAVQSDLFNRVLAQRIEQIDQVDVGDLAWKHINGAVFEVKDAQTEQPRCAALEISPTGPMFGPRMTTPTGRPAEIEERVLAESGVDLSRRRTPDGVRIDGARRPLRVPLYEADLRAGSDAHGKYVEIIFALPSGSYATVITREICKNREAVHGDS